MDYVTVDNAGNAMAKTDTHGLYTSGMTTTLFSTCLVTRRKR